MGKCPWKQFSPLTGTPTDAFSSFSCACEACALPPSHTPTQRSSEKQNKTFLILKDDFESIVVYIFKTTLYSDFGDLNTGDHSTYHGRAVPQLTLAQAARWRPGECSRLEGALHRASSQEGSGQ